MSKIWMMGGVAATALMAVLAATPEPARSSQDLLAKAQSEFATKARTAVMQRRVAQDATQAASQDPAVLEEIAAPQPAPYMVASLESLPPSPAARAETPVIAAAPVPVERSVEVPVVTGNSESIVTKASAPVADAAIVEKTAEVTVSPQPAGVVPESEPAAIAAAATPPVIEQVAPSTDAAVRPDAAARPHAAVTRKTRRASNQLATGHTTRQSEPGVSLDAMPRSLRSLRARAPEIAAMIERYM
jgi:hypothetical protein